MAGNSISIEMAVSKGGGVGAGEGAGVGAAETVTLIESEVFVPLFAELAVTVILYVPTASAFIVQDLEQLLPRLTLPHDCVVDDVDNPEGRFTCNCTLLQTVFVAPEQET